MAKTRSPNFPAIDLETAIKRARVLWDKEERHSAAAATIAGHWGYSPKSSGGLQTRAALRSFGLLEDVGGPGSGQARLTELARSILFSEEGSPQRLKHVQDAALRPAIHAEIWKKYDGRLPSDQNLRYYLVVDRGFSESGASELIREFRATIAFAQLTETAVKLSDEHEGKTENAGKMTTVIEERQTLAGPLAGQLGAPRSVQLPYSPTAWATLQAAFPLTDQEWDQMIAVLTAMKPALTETPKAFVERPTAPDAESPLPGLGQPQPDGH